MPVAFALSPAVAVVGLLDFTKSEHSKIYKSGIRAVTDTPFDCETEGLFQFLREVQDRASEMGWMDGILNVDITEEGDEDEETLSNLIENYGTLTLEQVIAHEEEYINTESREAQDTYMLYQCLMSSLSPEAKKKIMLWSEQYQLDMDDTKYSSGVALLKVIIRESHLDTNATSNSIRTKLSNLDVYIKTIDCDIGMFNQHVKLLVQSLAARNQTTSDLLINLFKGYGAVSDEEFRTWLRHKSESHDEGENELTPDKLMLAAKNKYDTMLEKGTWNGPTNEEKFVALEAKFTKNIKDLKKKAFELKKVGAKPAGNSNKTAKSNPKAKESRGDHPKTWASPKAGEKKKAEYNGFDWYWCGKDTGGHCEKWRAHDPKTCKGLASSGSKRPTDSSGGKKGKPNHKKLKVARAYVAKLEKREADEDTTDDETD